MSKLMETGLGSLKLLGATAVLGFVAALPLSLDLVAQVFSGWL